MSEQEEYIKVPKKLLEEITETLKQAKELLSKL